jgi:hypothetical protein
VAAGGETALASTEWNHRGKLPPRQAVFLLASFTNGSRGLICPWRRTVGGALTPEQADQLSAVRRRLAAEAATAGQLPALAWVTADGGVRPISWRIEPGWLKRKAHDGMTVPVSG